jgi:hypothetical protein
MIHGNWDQQVIEEKQELISIFSLWTFHLYITTFQQHLHMEYIFLRGLLLTRNVLNHGFLLVKLWSHHFEHFTIATMASLNVTDYLCHKWPWKCSTCRKHFTVLSSFMTDHWVCNYNNTAGATTGARTIYLSGEPEITPGFQLGSCYSIFCFLCSVL